MKEQDFPGLFCSTDQYSKIAQSRYMMLFRAELIAIVSGGFVGTLSITNDEWGKGVAALAAFLFLLGLLANIWIRFGRFEQQWYVGRAIAESIKSSTWKYMMEADPFKDSDANETFRNMLLTYIKENRTFITGDMPTAHGESITKKMTHTRLLPWQEKLTIYLSERVRDQHSWYEIKAKFNANKNLTYFVILVILYIICIGYYLLLIWENEWFNGAAFFATIISCVLSYISIKRYGELSNSYAVTANEIALVNSRGKEINNSNDFERYVEDAETAFSREHTLWLSRREVSI